MPPHGVDSRAAKKARPGEHAAFEVLRSKLDVPQPRAGIVQRTGVVERLSQGGSFNADAKFGSERISADAREIRSDPNLVSVRAVK